MTLNLVISHFAFRIACFSAFVSFFCQYPTIGLSIKNGGSSFILIADPNDPFIADVLCCKWKVAETD